MSLRPGGVRRISASIEWIETAIEAKKKNAPGINIFRMRFGLNSIIINARVIEKVVNLSLPQGESPDKGDNL
jgi:hypothetical protein